MIRFDLNLLMYCYDKSQHKIHSLPADPPTLHAVLRFLRCFMKSRLLAFRTLPHLLFYRILSSQSPTKY